MKHNKLSLAILASLSLMVNSGCSQSVMMVDYGAEASAEVTNISVDEGKQALAKKEGCCEALPDLSYLLVAKPGKHDYTLDTSSEIFTFSTGKSFVRGIELPQADEKIRVALSSPITKSVFVPSVLLLDADFTPVRLYGQSSIQYEKATMLTGERYFGEFSIHREDNVRYMIIFTTDEAMSGETKLAPLSKEALESGSAAVAKRYHLDQPVPHSAIGAVRVAFDYIPSSSEKSKQLIAAEVVSGNEQEAAAILSEKVEVQSEKAGSQPEKEAVYIEQIREAVSKGDLNEAMRLVKEAEAAGSKKARPAFIESLK